MKSRHAPAGTTMDSVRYSRSHGVVVFSIAPLDAANRVPSSQSTLALVDLAGSEAVRRQYPIEGTEFSEAVNIKKSLSMLRRVIDVLLDNTTLKNEKWCKLPPYGDSVLTSVLSDGFNVRAKPYFVATVSPHVTSLEDTLGTLRYAFRVKNIFTAPKANLRGLPPNTPSQGGKVTPDAANTERLS